MHLGRFAFPSCSRAASSAIHGFPVASKISRRSFVSQTLLSRTDFERKTVTELKEELKKRGITTGSKLKTKSTLITKILQDEEQKQQGDTLPHASQPHPIFEKSSKTAGPIEVKISSPVPVVARIMEDVEQETPAVPKTDNTEETAGTSAALASPVSNELSMGHHASIWPASINLPETPAEEIDGTAIPFIPDNYDSHRQSYAAELAEVKGTSAGLEFSTASHPSTLPEGGPSLAAVDKEESLLPSKARNEGDAAFPDDALSGLAGRLRDLWSLSPTSTERLARPSERFEFEDRPLNGEERRGLYTLFGLVSFGWLLGGFFAPVSSSDHRLAS